jgi:hypothetical protein
MLGSKSVNRSLFLGVLPQTIKANQIKKAGYGRLESNSYFVKPQKLMD